MKGRGFIGQTLLLMGGQGFGKVFSFVSFMIIARLLGPSLYGSFTFALTFGSLLAFIPNMGVDPFYSREVPTGREKARELLGVVLILKIAGSVVFFLIYTGGIFLSTTNNEVRGASYFIGTAIVLLSLTLTCKAVLITSSRCWCFRSLGYGSIGYISIYCSVIYVCCPYYSLRSGSIFCFAGSWTLDRRWRSLEISRSATISEGSIPIHRHV